MLTLEVIEHAIEQLASEDLMAFRRWFAEFDTAAWDAQIEADAAAGRLDRFAAEALAEFDIGAAREI